MGIFLGWGLFEEGWKKGVHSKVCAQHRTVSPFWQLLSILTAVDKKLIGSFFKEKK